MSGNFLGLSLPFGMSNKSNPTATAAPPANPNFPSNKQLDPKNQGADPNNQNLQQQQNEPNNNPNNNADPSKGQGSQLDNFKDLFKLPTDNEGNTVVPQDPLATPLLSVDPAKLQEAAKRMNFTAGIQPQQVQEAMQDPAKMIALLNAVGQNAFFSAMQANAGVVETAFAKHTERFDQALPDRVRQLQISQAQAKHPALSHPAAQPVLAALKQSVAMANPHLTPDQVASHAENYVIAMAGDINNVNQQQANASKPKDPAAVDWASTLGLPQQ